MNQPTRLPRLRILHIVSGDRWAGAEVQVFTLLKELNANHDIFAIILNRGELSQRLANLDIPVTVFDETKMNFWQIFKGTVKTLKNLKPDVVHTHRQKENIIGSLANYLSLQTICLRTVHGDSEYKPTGTGKIIDFLDILCGRYFQQAIIAVSDDLRKKLELKFKSKKITTVLNGIDPEATREGLIQPDFKAVRPGHFHIGIIGRLDPVKRIDIFLHMASILLKNYPELPWHFHIFGEGTLDTEMRDLSAILKITDNVTFHGHRMDIRNCIFGLNAVVICSDHEGLPMTALECITIRTPLIAHSTGGLTELLKNATDSLVKNHTAECYSDAVLKFVTTNLPEVNFPEQYCINNTASATVRLYLSIL